MTKRDRDASCDPLERALLDSFDEDAPRAGAKSAVVASLGLGASMGTTTAAASTAGAAASTQASVASAIASAVVRAPVHKVGALLFIKWMSVGMVLGSMAIGAPRGVRAVSRLFAPPPVEIHSSPGVRPSTGATSVGRAIAMPLLPTREEPPMLGREPENSAAEASPVAITADSAPARRPLRPPQPLAIVPRPSDALSAMGDEHREGTPRFDSSLGPQPAPPWAPAPLVASSEKTQKAGSVDGADATEAEDQSKPSSPDSTRPTATLAAELARLDQARASMNDPRAALLVLDAYDREFPRGTLRPEAVVLRVQAYMAAGDRRRAAETAHDFGRALPARYVEKLHHLLSR